MLSLAVVSTALFSRGQLTRGLSPAMADALADTRSTTNWDPVLNSNGVRVWKRVEKKEQTSAPMAIKSSVYAAVPPQFFTDLLLTRDYDTARRFNPTLDGGRDLEWRDGDRERISHVLTKPVLILKPRDFVVRVRRESRRDGTELVLNAPDVHRLAPVARTHVRGTLNGLHLVEPHSDGKGCVYTMTSQMDPAGAVPLAVVNWFALRRPLQYMVALRDLAEERYAASAEEVEEAAADGVLGPRQQFGRLLQPLARSLSARPRTSVRAQQHIPRQEPSSRASHLRARRAASAHPSFMESTDSCTTSWSASRGSRHIRRSGPPLSASLHPAWASSVVRGRRAAASRCDSTRVWMARTCSALKSDPPRTARSAHTLAGASCFRGRRSTAASICSSGVLSSSLWWMAATRW